MTLGVHADGAGPEMSIHTPDLGSLMRSELLRLWSRRFVRWAMIGFLGGLVIAAGIVLANANAMPSQSDTASNTTGVGVGVAALSFILGATVAGAEWSHKTMPALLFWEPRRVRVFVVKLVALAAVVSLALVVAEVVWFAFYEIVIAVNASTVPGSIGWSTTTADLLRSLLLVLTSAATAFGLASLIRNTGAALGVAFVYFAVAELLLRVLVSASLPWLLTSNIGALMSPNGLDPGNGHVISDVRGGAVLLFYAIVICAAALELFRRRDVT